MLEKAEKVWQNMVDLGKERFLTRVVAYDKLRLIMESW